MKPSRKLSRGSFVMRVSGGNPSGGGALTELIGAGKKGIASDHDFGHAGGESGHGSAGAGDADSDSGPQAGR